MAPKSYFSQYLQITTKKIKLHPQKQKMMQFLRIPQFRWPNQKYLSNLFCFSAWSSFKTDVERRRSRHPVVLFPMFSEHQTGKGEHLRFQAEGAAQLKFSLGYVQRGQDDYFTLTISNYWHKTLCFWQFKCKNILKGFKGLYGIK